MQGKKGSTTYSTNPVGGPDRIKGYKPYTQKDFNHLQNN